MKRQGEKLNADYPALPISQRIVFGKVFGFVVETSSILTEPLGLLKNVSFLFSRVGCASL